MKTNDRKQNGIFKLAFFQIILFTVSCAPNKQLLQGINDASMSDEHDAAQTPNNQPIPPAIQSMNLDGFISGGPFDQHQAIHFNKMSGKLLINLPLSANQFLSPGMSLELPQLSGVEIVSSQDNQGNIYLSIAVPINYITRGLTAIHPAKLPNGDPLPQIAGGELPEVAFTLNAGHNTKLYIYIGVDIIAVYVESKFDPYIKLTYPIRNQARTKVVGYFSTIPAKKPQFQGGFFITTQLPIELAQILDEYYAK